MGRDGFNPEHPVPVDENDDILGGAHRVACALALQIRVHCVRSDKLAWAPEWGSAWFKQMGMPPHKVEELLKDRGALAGFYAS